MLAVILLLISPASARPPEDYEAPPGIEESAEGPREEGAQAPRVDVSLLLKSGHALYFKGDHAGALKAYEAAVKLSSRSLEGWLNGAVVLAELGSAKRAVDWHARAAGISKDAATVGALGWAQLRAGRHETAEATFKRALQTSPNDTYALLGLARARLASQDPAEAAALLKRTAEASPLLNLTYFFMGRAYEALGDPDRTVEAYRQSVGTDSYFHEGREALARAYLRRRSASEALRQFNRLLIADPGNKRVKAMVHKVQPLLGIKPGSPPAAVAAPSISVPELQAGGPLIRAVIWSTGMGKPKARTFVSFSASSDFLIEDLKGKKLAEGRADDFWTVELKAKGKRRLMQLSDPAGRFRLVRGEPFVVKPDPRGVIALSETGPRPTALSTPKLLRGVVEVGLTPSRRSLRLVNIIDLERYTHGVVSAEMPIRSPIEALKAQAVVARSHALFIKKVTRRHRRDGYDVCDDQHCQVYAGLRAESARSRSVVDGTRKRVAMFGGRVAHVIYSSNCGGHTQSGSDLTGWGNLVYWKGVPDSPEASAKPPRSPWLLRRHLSTMPQAYCKPSNYVHPSLYRWTRVISWRELEERTARRFKGLGRLKHVRALRRAASGNVNTLVLVGTKKSVKVTSEMTIRGLLGVGSVRSTLFTFDTEYDQKGKPLQLIFHGGGWGHAVGLCQSGAMGRAEAGQDYGEIVKAYFTGVTLGDADY